MISFPNAKINLGLNIVSKREDGYHNLETVFYPIGIKDALEVIESSTGKDEFFETGIKVESNYQNNLVIRALDLMRTKFDIPFVEIHLLKKIPTGAGIGGGSADAAFMLKLLNNKFELNLSKDELASIALELGADCPFFIYNQPLFAGGVGEIFQEIELSLENYHIILVKPEINVSTKDAFANIEVKEPKISIKEIIHKPIEEWKGLLKNDFETTVFAKHPSLEHIKDKLYALGAVYASMSGSGSSVYGLFSKKTDYKHHFPDCFVWEESL